MYEGDFPASISAKKFPNGKNSPTLVSLYVHSGWLTFERASSIYSGDDI
jgi:hypothetical protein